LLAIALPAAFAALLGYFMFYGRISDVYPAHPLTVTLILFNSVNSTPVRNFTSARPAWRLQRHSGIPPLTFPATRRR